MDLAQLRQYLQESLEDRRLSRGERKTLRKIFEETGLDARERALVRKEAFSLAETHFSNPERRAILGWLEEVEHLLDAATDNPDEPSRAQVGFSPGDGCLDLLDQLLRRARATLDICVFTITDDRITRAIDSAFRRKVNVRIVSDDDKANDLGSDLYRLKEGGVPVVFDTSPHHMHHKFAIADRKTLLTGSYNWTRSAANSNEENVVVTEDQRLVSPFLKEFDRLWKTYS